MEKLDEIRERALSRVDAVERQYRLAFFGGVALEGVLIVLFLFAADLSNRTHVLILLGSVMSYSLVILGLVALGAHVNRTALRILQAIDAARAQQEGIHLMENDSSSARSSRGLTERLPGS